MCANNSDLAQTLNNDDELDPWLALILTLIYESIKDSESRWYPYIQLLPKEFDTLMFWSEQELEELQASAVRAKVGRDGADMLFQNVVLPFIRQPESLFDVLPAFASYGDEDLLRLAHRMGSVLMAYGFDLESASSKQPDADGYVSDDEEEDMPKGMIPMADMLNADAEECTNARLYYEQDSVVMKALKPIKAGDQIFNDYGPLPRSDLLRRYGYISDKYTQYDVVEISESDCELVIPAELTHDPKAIQVRKEYCDDSDFPDTSHDISWPVKDESFFPQALRFQLFVKTSSAFTERRPLEPCPAPLDGDVAYQMWSNILQARLAQYTTTSDQDQILLENLCAGGQTATRKVMAIQIRLGEKKLLEAAITEAQRLHDESRTQTASIDMSSDFTSGTAKPITNDQERPNKRLKTWI